VTKRVPVAGVAVLIATSPPIAAQSSGFAEALRRSHQYVVLYEDHELSTVLAEERYHQEVRGAAGRLEAQRTLRSDFLIFQLPPEEDWFALRDVYEVDGKPIGDRQSRLKRLFSGPAADASERAMNISKESARFNLGNVYRTINVPSFALRFLRPASRSRFAFTDAGRETVGDADTVVVAYEEVGRPTFVATAEGRDVPAKGRFWIDPASGAVVRSEMITGGTRRVPARATITVTYALDQDLGFRVPIEMRERYDEPRDERSGKVTTGVATYSTFRRFDARTMLVKPK
jgi:hypothetical protein